VKYDILLLKNNSLDRPAWVKERPHGNQPPQRR
jgi:hypothetical protein